MNNFERASRAKLRFQMEKGSISTEDLWDLSLQSLDALAKKVSKVLREDGEESFIPSNVKTKSSTENNLRLELLKHVINAKVEQNEASKLRAERQAALNQLKELAAAKSNEQLASKSLDEILKQIKDLETSLV